MTVLSDTLELIVQDLEAAASRAIRRRQRHRMVALVVAGLVAASILGSAVAAVATGRSYLDLVRSAYPDADVESLSDRQARVLADIASGPVSIVATDLGVSERDVQAAAGVDRCTWSGASKLLDCTAGPGAVTIPAGTHRYRIQPSPGTRIPDARQRVLFVPDLELELFVEPESAG